ncbi:MAG: hypothetical protein QOG43_1786, partial [Actinomycetota bacterium]|nr:hypothetical protein [Actinomycetota bacterium]
MRPIGASLSRESLLARTLVELADTLVDDYDVVELLTLLTDRCVDVLDVAAAGLMLVAPDGDLRVMASSSETMRLLELFELQAQEGPCLDCYRTGAPVVNQDLTGAGGRWPHFAAQAHAEGFLSVHALPMRLRGTIIGALNLFRTDRGQMGEADVAAAQSLADVATIALLQHRSVGDTQALNEQLHYALNGRVVIEQAKGIVAERAGIDVDLAFTTVRGHARRHQLRLVDLALAIVVGDQSVEGLDQAPARVPPPTNERPAAAPLARAVVALTEIEPVLALVEAAAPVDGVEVVVSELAAMVGAEQASFLIADFGGDALLRFGRAHRDGARPQGAPEILEKVHLAGTPYQRALVTQRVQVVPDHGRYRLLAPVSDRGDALGVLEVVLPSHPDDALVAKVASSAHAL